MDLDFNNLDDIKIFTSFYIDEHKLNKDDKAELHQFVIEADLNQMKCLLTTGEMKSKTEALKEGDNVILYNPTWSQLGRMFTKGHTYQKGLSTGAMSGVAATVLVAAVATIAYKTYKNYFSKAAKACKGKEGLEKKNCMVKFKKAAQKAKLQDLQKGLAFCAKTKDPTSCKNKLQVKIAKEKAKMGEL